MAIVIIITKIIYVMPFYPYAYVPFSLFLVFLLIMDEKENFSHVNNKDDLKLIIIEIIQLDGDYVTIRDKFLKALRVSFIEENVHVNEGLMKEF